jgi:ribosomal protein S18 acetylase RimI-like enzyme
VIVRAALAGEREAVGALRVGAYEAQGLLAASPGYADTLRDLGFDGTGTVRGAVDGDEDTPGDADGKLLGTVTSEPWHGGSEIARGPEDAEVRALAVAQWAQGNGAGRVLMRAVIDRAAASGARRLLLSTQPAMKAAQHLYLALGFDRAPELDWEPVPGVTLLGFALTLR